MDIISALVTHHSDLRQLYAQSEADGTVFDEFIRHLIVHHTMEEKYFYDILQQIAQVRKDALEAVNEHHIIELIIKDAERFPREHEIFPIKIESLGEYTTHHLDEEENAIFPLAQQVISPDTLLVLGKLFLEAKDKLLNISLPTVPATISGRTGAQLKRAQPSASGVQPGRSASPGIAAAAEGNYITGLGIGSLKQ